MNVKTEFFRLEVLETLMLVTSHGPWDDRVARAYVQAVEQLILSHYQGRPWAVLHDGRQWELGTPEIQGILSEHMGKKLTGTLTHVAYVCGPSLIKRWQVFGIAKPATAYETRLFETLAEAEAWLASKGYTRS